MADIYDYIASLATYGEKRGLSSTNEHWYAINRMLAKLHLDTWEERTGASDASLPLREILDHISSWAIAHKIIQEGEKDILDAEMMDAITPRPQTVIDRFWRTYAVSPQKATQEFFQFSIDTNYIQKDRIAKDLFWEGNTKYGKLDILISLSKPELDPKAIEAAGKKKAVGYPKCALCVQNMGYRGRADAAPRANHRLIPILLEGQQYFFQFSPYRYCHQHCIVLSEKHEPMHIDGKTIRKLLAFVTMFPHYFLGSNADLPFVGGSVLSHDHFQGGVFRLPIMDARDRQRFSVPKTIEVSTLHWPLSTIKLVSKQKELVSRYADAFISSWRTDIHHTITPLAHRDGESYVLYLMLRDNSTSPERPEGIFHTRPEYFHIKKEGIGIIDAPGMAILPPRLKRELEKVEQCLLGDRAISLHPEIQKHAKWMEELREKHHSFDPLTIDGVLKQEIVNRFCLMLEDCAVFRQTEQGQKEFTSFVLQSLPK